MGSGSRLRLGTALSAGRSADRALVELRLADRRWALDTYLQSGTNRQTLLDRTVTHLVERWHVATLTHDGTTMSHFIDGVAELSAPTVFAPEGFPGIHVPTTRCRSARCAS